MMIDGAIEQEALELLSFYVESVDYIAHESIGEDGDDIKLMLQDMRDNGMNGDKNAVRRLHVMARHYLATIRYIISNTSAEGELRDLLNKAISLPMAAPNEE